MSNFLGSMQSMASNIGAAMTSLANRGARRLSLTAPYLSHLLWLISQRFQDLAREGYGSNAAVYAVLSVLCSAVAEPPLVPYLRQEDGSPDLTSSLDWRHPLVQLLRRPNPWLTEYEHYEIITLHLGITGRYTCWKERNNDGSVRALWPLRPDRVGPVYGDAAAGEPLLLGWSYLVPGTAHYLGLPAADVIMLNFPDPLGESGGIVEGLGPLQALAIEVGADLEASRFVGNVVANYGQPGMVIQLKRGLRDADDARLIKEAFMRDFGGSRRGQPAVLDADSTIAPIGFSLRDLEFPNLRRVSESRIAGAFHVPAILAGLLVGLEASSTNATVDEIRAFFAETTLAGYWRRFADGFTNQLAVEYDDDIICLFDLTKVQALSGRASARVDEIRDGFERGVVKVAEYREALGLEDDPNADVYIYGIAPGRGSQVPVSPASVADTDAASMAPTAQTGISQQKSAGGWTETARAWNTGTRPEQAADVGTGAAQMRSAFDDLMAGIEVTPAMTVSNGHARR